MADDRPRSWEVTEGPQRAPARAMLRAVGFSEEDFGKSQIAVASSWNEVTPCNYHLDKLAALAKEGVRQGGAVPIEFTTIAVSDGIAMGHEGMKASLISREVIADSVELVMHAERFDGLVGIAGCDKSEPAMLMAMARLNLPSVYLYGGTILRAPTRAATSRSRTCSRRSARTRRARSTTTSCSRSSAPPAPPPVRAPGCTPPTPWRRRPRRWACRSPVRRHPRPSTIAERSSRASPVARWRHCSPAAVRVRAT